MTTHKATVRGARKPQQVCSICGEPLTANPEGIGWRVFTHTDEGKIYDHIPSLAVEPPEEEE